MPGQPVVNLVDYLTRRFNTSVAAQFLERLSDIATNAAGESNRGEAFWASHANTLIHSAIDAALIAQGTASITDIDQIVATSPASLDEIADDSYKDTPCGRILEAARDHHRPEEKHRYRRAAEYFTQTLPSLGERARGAITSQIQNVVGRLCVEPFREALSGETVLSPEQIENEALICAIDYPILRHGVAGRLFQAAITMLCQMHCLERDASGIDRPFVIARDEAGLLLHGEYDLQCQIVARSQKLAHIDAFQDMDVLIRALGGSGKSQHEAYGFASNHRTVFAFGNDNFRTNEYYSKLLGSSLQIVIGGGGGGRQPTGDFLDDVLGSGGGCNWSQQFLPRLRPDAFFGLPTGVCYLIEGGNYRLLDLRKKG